MLDNKLVLVRGLPGSGKSTFAKRYSEDWFAVHLEADMYHMVNGVYQFNGDNVPKAHAWCFETTKILLNSGVTVVVSNTFTKISEMQKYLDLADTLGIEREVYRSFGNFGSIHNVPEEVMVKMRDRFQDYPSEIIINGENQ